MDLPDRRGGSEAALRAARWCGWWTTAAGSWARPSTRSESKISLRWLTLRRHADRRATSSSPGSRRPTQLRRRVLPGETTYRVVHGEADRLPGLVVDRFGDYLSVQFLVPGMDQRKELIADLLDAHFKPQGRSSTAPTWACASSRVSPPRRACCAASCPRGRWATARARSSCEVDLINGQKTGAFLDQRENHLAVAPVHPGRGARLLRLRGRLRPAAGQGGDRGHRGGDQRGGLRAAEGQRRSATGSRNVDVVAANAFDFLRDTLDEGQALRHRRARPARRSRRTRAPSTRRCAGTRRSTCARCSCSSPAASSSPRAAPTTSTKTRFEEMLDSAAADAGRKVQIVEKRGAGQGPPGAARAARDAVPQVLRAAGAVDALSSRPARAAPSRCAPPCRTRS